MPKNPKDFGKRFGDSKVIKDVERRLSGKPRKKEQKVVKG